MPLAPETLRGGTQPAHLEDPRQCRRLLGRLADAWGLDAVFTALGLLMALAFLFTAFVLTPVQEPGRPWSAG